jgi:hypothetical protein
MSGTLVLYCSMRCYFIIHAVNEISCNRSLAGTEFRVRISLQFEVVFLISSGYEAEARVRRNDDKHHPSEILGCCLFTLVESCRTIRLIRFPKAAAAYYHRELIITLKTTGRNTTIIFLEVLDLFEGRARVLRPLVFFIN